VKKQSKKRFGAKLLFQFRIQASDNSGKRRLCEDRIILLNASNAKAALFEAKQKGRAAEHKYKNNKGWFVHFEFVGILELLCLDPACDADEVWYEISERNLPMENRRKMIPPESKLSAIRSKE